MEADGRRTRRGIVSIPIDPRPRGAASLPRLAPMPDADSSSPRLRVVIGDARGRPIAVAGLAQWLRRVAPARARGTVSIALVSDRVIQSLNRTYRHKDAATDVLSFPASGPAPGPQPPAFGLPPSLAVKTHASYGGSVVAPRAKADQPSAFARRNVARELRRTRRSFSEGGPFLG